MLEQLSNIDLLDVSNQVFAWVHKILTRKKNVVELIWKVIKYIQVFDHLLNFLDQISKECQTT